MLCLEVVLDGGNGAAERLSDAAADDEHSRSLCRLVAPSNGHAYRHASRHAVGMHHTPMESSRRGDSNWYRVGLYQGSGRTNSNQIPEIVFCSAASALPPLMTITVVVFVGRSAVANS